MAAPGALFPLVLSVVGFTSSGVGCSASEAVGAELPMEVEEPLSHRVGSSILFLNSTFGNLGAADHLDRKCFWRRHRFRLRFGSRGRATARLLGLIQHRGQSGFRIDRRMVHFFRLPIGLFGDKRSLSVVPFGPDVPLSDGPRMTRLILPIWLASASFSAWPGVTSRVTVFAVIESVALSSVRADLIVDGKDQDIFQNGLRSGHRDAVALGDVDHHIDAIVRVQQAAVRTDAVGADRE